MYRMFAVATLALALVVVSATAKEYKNATIVKADDDSITVKLDGSDKEVTIKVTEKTTYASMRKMKGETEAKEVESTKENFSKMMGFVKDKGAKATITTTGDDKEDPTKDKLTAAKIVTVGGKGGPGKGKGDKAKKDL
jgi:electron transfer flavoprotein alpha subunit